jgi:hypothetical protein
MKHLALYENYYATLNEDEKMASYTCLYLESIMPVSIHEGFIECRFEFIDNNKLELAFYFRYMTSEESFEKFYNFLEKEKLKIKREHSGPKEIETIVVISEYKMKKYSSLYENITKYNI